MITPEFSTPPIAPLSPTPTAPVLPVFHTQAPAHDDDLAAAGDELRDQWAPDPKDLA